MLMLRKVLSCVVLLLLVKAQNFMYNRYANKVFFSIQVKDADTKEPVIGAVITITSERDSSLKITGFSDANGMVEVMVPAHTPFSITIKHPQYSDTVIKVAGLTEDVFWGVLYLKQAVKKLPEVTVKASRVDVEFDKKEYIVTEKMRRRATTATDILKELPDIQYDPFRDQLMVRGSVNVLYLVNGVEKPAEYVKNISPQRILKVEIYRNPTGRYALEGYDAVINIILRDDYVGWELTFGGQNSFSISKKYSPALTPYMFGFFRAAVVRYRTTFRLAFYNWRYNSFASRYDSLTYYGNVQWLQRPVEDGVQAFNSLMEGWGFAFYTGVDWSPIPRHQLSLDYRFSSVIVPYASKARYLSTDVISQVENIAHNENSPLSHRIRLTHTWQYTKDYKLQTSISYTYSRSITYSLYEESGIFTIEQVQESKGPELKGYWEWDGTLINGKLGLLMGTLFEVSDKMTSLNTILNGINITQEKRPTISYKLSSIKPYAYITWNVVKKVSVRAGAGLQYIWFNVSENVQDRFFYVEPAFDLSWKPINMLTAVFSYRLDVQNPSISRMLSATIVENRYVKSSGNPDLRPFASHELMLDISGFGGFVSLTPYYRWSTDYISDVWVAYGKDSLVKLPVQGVQFREWGVEFSLPVPLYKRFVVLMLFGKFSSIDIRWKDLRNSLKRFTNFVALIYNNDRLQISAGVGGMNFIAKEPLLQGYFMQISDGPPDFYGVFVRKQFWKRRGSATIYLTLPWEVKGIDYHLLTEVTAQGWHSYTEIYSPVMRSLVGIMLRFNIAEGRIVRDKKRDGQLFQGFPMF